MIPARCAPTARRLGLALLGLSVLALGGCATVPPHDTDNICRIFGQYPSWYDDAHHAQERWGTPIPVLMAFVRRESDFRERARPKRHWFLFIPLPRKSSAYGYAQIQDPVWHDYRQANGGWFKRRTSMFDSLDFIGWYTHRIHRELGIPQGDARHLYLAYYEGIGGYRAGAWRHDRLLLRIARAVSYRARRYREQLPACEERLRCRHWYQWFCH